ncbi:MAG: hypothetical protein M3Z04_15295 [Chloroflexota bacterium]|nr:hypothetical protein [Chloroflexota bacterium]
MPKKDHKAQKAKARQQAIRKQKAQVNAQPRILRENPGLGPALSPRHPLVGYFVNEDWEVAKMASVHCVRDAGDGQVIASFLVDTAWKGTKDCFGESGLGNAIAELEDRLADMADRHGNLPVKIVPVDAPVAVNLIRGGIAWARQQRQLLPHDLDLWLRLVDPLPPGGPDLSGFGNGAGQPLIIGTLDELLLGGLPLDDLLGDAEDDDVEWDEEDEWEADDDSIIEGEIIALPPAAPGPPPAPAPTDWQPRRPAGWGDKRRP